MELGQTAMGEPFQVVPKRPPCTGPLLAAAILFAAASAVLASQPRLAAQNAPQRDAPSRILPRDPRLLYMGRVAFTGEEEASFGFPGITLRFAYRGPAPRLLLGAGSATCFFNLSCNGWDPVLIHPPEGRSEVPLPSGPAPDSGWVVELVRRTESWQGLATFHGLELPPGCELLTPPPLPARRLLIIGDSITSGERLDSVAPEFDPSPRATNAPRSYGMLLGRWLGAQVHLVSFGGRGLTRDWRGSSEVANAPQFFQRALPEDPGSRWEHASYPPDVVLICLGTNDFNSDLPEAFPFIKAYDRFLDEIRRVHPGAAVILAESPVIGEAPGTLDRSKRDLLRRCLDGVVARRWAAGDIRVTLAPLHKQPGTARDPHPVAFQHELIAEELLPVLRAMMGW